MDNEVYANESEESGTELFDGKWFPTPALQERYGVGKQSVCDRINHLGFKSSKIGRNTYVTLDELSLLDAIHAHIEAGNTLASFKNSSAIAVAQTQQLAEQPEAEMIIADSPADFASIANSEIEAVVASAKSKAANLAILHNRAVAHFLNNPAGLDAHQAEQIQQSAAQISNVWQVHDPNSLWQRAGLG